ncbi:MAG: protein kinase [Acidobacteriota bacterium]
MTTFEHWQRLEELFHKLLECTPKERDLLLKEICADDITLFKELESLIASDEEVKSGGFLNPPFPLAGKVAEIQPELLGLVLDDKYRIDKQLGQGGMGMVYLATHLGTTRLVALKVIAPKFMANTEFVERFKREAAATGCLRHPNVVNVTDFGFAQIGSQPIAYLVMEYLDGLTLGQFIKKVTALPLGLVTDLVEQICLAVAEAHRQGIIHRDLKPDNIWLEPNGRGGYNVKVLDFGLAKLRDGTLGEIAISTATAISTNEPRTTDLRTNSVLPTLRLENSSSSQADTQLKPDTEQTRITDKFEKILTEQNRDIPTSPHSSLQLLTRIGTVIGTPLYMSPEQCAGAQVDARSDIYSLGVIVYQMLTGEPPFSGNLPALLKQHMQSSVPQILEKRHDIPKPVAALIRSTLAKNPQDRPASATALAVALRVNAEGEIPLLNQANNIHNRMRTHFLRLSLCCHFPLIILALLLPLLHNLFFLLSLPIILFANTVNTAACVIVMERLYLIRGDFPDLRSTFLRLKDRLPALFYTMLANSMRVFMGLLRFIWPGIKTYAGHALYAPVVMLEGIQGQAALTRSHKLVERFRHLAFALQIYDFFIGLILMALFLSTVFNIYWFIGKTYTLTTVIEKLQAQGLGFLFGTVLILVSPLIASISHSRFAIAFFLLYQKACQASNEEINSTAQQPLDPIIMSPLSITSYKQRALLLFNLFKNSVIVLAAVFFILAVLAKLFHSLGLPTGDFFVK